MEYDLKITGGTIIDGTGSPAREGDVAIKDGKIAAVGEAPGKATATVEARGRNQSSRDGVTPRDWLAAPWQRLAEVTAGPSSMTGRAG